MTFFSKRKRKNDDPPRFPAWILVLIAVGMVVIIAMLLQPVSRNIDSVSVMSAGSTFTLDPIELTATYIIKQATAFAQATPRPDVASSSDNSNAIELTATYIVQQATAQKVAELTGTPGT
jgi:hypothetical protein